MDYLSHNLHKFNRFELKYLITLQQAEKYKTALRAFLLPDEHGNNNGRFALTSLYYGWTDLRCYWEKENGIQFRRKLRVRHYKTGEVFPEDTPVFLEIKQCIDRVTQKRRAILAYGDTLWLCNDRQIPENAPEDKAAIEEIHSFLWEYNLRPVSIVCYDRQALMGTENDVGLRVTFDTALSFQTYPLHLQRQPSGLPLISKNDLPGLAFYFFWSAT